MRFVGLLVVLSVLLTCSSAEAKWLRRWRTSNSQYSTQVSVNTEFTGDAAAICAQKASIMASHCRMWHMGGSFGGFNFEGVGCGTSREAALNVCCYTGQRVCVAEAAYQGSNGMWYACKFFR